MKSVVRFEQLVLFLFFKQNKLSRQSTKNLFRIGSSKIREKHRRRHSRSRDMLPVLTVIKRKQKSKALQRRIKFKLHCTHKKKKRWREGITVVCACGRSNLLSNSHNEIHHKAKLQTTATNYACNIELPRQKPIHLIPSLGPAHTKKRIELRHQSSMRHFADSS